MPITIEETYQKIYDAVVTLKQKNLKDDKSFKFLMDQYNPIIVNQVNKIISKYKSLTRQDFDEVKSDAIIVLLRAIKSFNPDGNINFTTYFTTRLRNDLEAFVQTGLSETVIKVPRSIQDQAKLISKFMDDYYDKKKKQPTNKEIVDYMKSLTDSKGQHWWKHYDESKLSKVFEYLGKGRTDLDKPTGKDDNLKTIDTIITETLDPSKTYLRKQLKKELNNAYYRIKNKLNPDEQNIYIMYFFHGMVPKVIEKTINSQRISILTFEKTNLKREEINNILTYLKENNFFTKQKNLSDMFKKREKDLKKWLEENFPKKDKEIFNILSTHYKTQFVFEQKWNSTTINKFLTEKLADILKEDKHLEEYIEDKKFASQYIHLIKVSYNDYMRKVASILTNENKIKKYVYKG